MPLARQGVKLFESCIGGDGSADYNHKSAPASERLEDFNWNGWRDLIEIRTSTVERAMEVQEVILRAIDGRVKWYHAAEILGISDACGAFIQLIPQINPK